MAALKGFGDSYLACHVDVSKVRFMQQTHLSPQKGDKTLDPQA
jgi:hypothetical protein